MTETAAPVSFGPYLLVRAAPALGRLEMAVRTDVRDPEVCILKRLPIRARAADAAARFRRQAQLAARLEHENIARTLRVETIDGQVCVARELVEGMTLSKVMRALGARPAPLIAALHIVHEMARGLAYAHECGGLNVVHGEVAPENVMIAFSGQVKLIDFGIGRPAGDATPGPAGVVVGHRGFLPPEAADLPEPDRAGDLYGLGVVLWELLTGHRADNAPELPLPDVRTLNPEIADELARIVARATAVSPQDRPSGAEELGAALTTFLPPGTDPQQETAALLRSCFDVDTLQPLLAAEIAGTKRLATGEASPTDPPPRLTTPLRLSVPRAAPAVTPGANSVSIPARDRGPLLTLAVALAVAGGGIALLRYHGEGTSPPTAVVATAPPPAVPAPPPAAAPTPAPLAADLVEAPRSSRRGPPGAARATRDDGPERLLRQANDLFERGNTAGALALTRQAIAAGAGAPAHVLMATLLINLRNYNAAEPELAEAIRLDPRNDEAHRLLLLLRRTAAEQSPP
jgi:eukaryotic-like serine/threonine-protein kinase